MRERDSDVVVVGGGPAGAVSAMLLAQRGHQVILLDRAHFPRPKACGEYLSPGTLRVLDRLGLQPAVERAEPHFFRGMEIMAPSGARFPVTYDDDNGVLLAAGAKRERFDFELVTAARAAGVEIVEGFTVREPIVHQGWIQGVQGTRNGNPERVRAPITIIADGARSRLARVLGVARPPRWPFRMGIMAYFRGAASLPENLGLMRVSPSGYCGIAPLGRDVFNVAVVSRASALRDSRLSALAFLESWLHQDPVLRHVLDSCARLTPVRGVSPIGARASRVWLPGALLVGDAAGFFDPFTGEGIYRAIRGAELASQAASVFLEVRTRQSLREYARQRTRAFCWKTGVSALVQCFVQYPTLMAYALPRLSTRATPGHLLSMVLGDVRPARSFLRPAVLWEALRP